MDVISNVWLDKDGGRVSGFPKVTRISTHPHHYPFKTDYTNLRRLHVSGRVELHCLHFPAALRNSLGCSRWRYAGKRSGFADGETPDGVL